MAQAQLATLPSRIVGRFRRGLTFEAFEREVFFILSAGISAYIYTALASYSSLDPSWNSITLPVSKTENLAGSLGAEISSYLIYWLGLSSFLLPIPFLFGATVFLSGRRNGFSKYRLLGWFIAILAVTTILDRQIPMVEYGQITRPSGGALGTFISQFLMGTFGDFGGIIVVATLLLAAIVLISRRVIITPAYAGVKDRIGNNEDWTARFTNLFRRSKLSSQKANVDSDTQPVFESEPELIIAAFEAPAVPAPEQKPRTMPKLTFLGRRNKTVDPKDAEDVAIDVDGDDDKQAQAPYLPPPTDIFQKQQSTSSDRAQQKSELEQTAADLIETLQDFGVTGKIIGYQTGPVVTVYEFQPDNGVKQSKVMGLIDDIALALRVDSIFINPVSGKRALGIQVPNRSRETVYFGDVVSTEEFQGTKSPLTFGMGKSINGQVICSDLATMPHLLMAGATGSGKSVAINVFLCSIVMKASPEKVRMILVDPKMLELSVYEGIPHLLMPVITDSQRASLALQWAVVEMERRYKLMQLAAVRNIDGFNAFWEKASEEKKEFLKEATPEGMVGPLPKILLVIDELADLMMTAPKDVEASIQRLAQKARASGIHMVLATQRPSVDIITGVIKANLPCRVAFQVVSKHDSRTILDQPGADKLLGKGDLLLQKPGLGRLERIQGAFISDEEVLRLAAAAREGYTTDYDQSIIDWIDEECAKSDSDPNDFPMGSADDDPKWDEALNVAQAHGVVSASFLQRNLKIGYNRAARIVDIMEKQGLVGKADGSKPRKWLGMGSDGL